jgi:hypothetical protein
MRRLSLAFLFIALTVGQGRGAPAPPPVLWTVQTTDNAAPDVTFAADGGVTVGSQVFHPVANPALTTLTHYSKTGVRLWRIAEPAASFGFRSLRTDSTGNIFTVGPLESADGSDLMIRKYTGAGLRLWSRQFGTPIHDFSPGFAIGSDGTTFITNAPWAANYGVPPARTTTLLRQFLPDGTPGWVATLDPNDGWYPGLASSGHGTAIDRQGNIISIFSNYQRDGIYVFGRTYLSKTSSSGQVQWIKQIDVPNLVSTAIDDANNLYVASNSLYKYDPNGELLWKVTDTLSNGQYFANCLGPDGTQYVAGKTFFNDQWAGMVAAYDPGGMQLWSKLITAPPGSTGLFMHGLTLSGDQLVAAGQLTSVINNITHPTGNYIVSLQVPEPTHTLLLFMSVLFAVRQRSARHARAFQ